jgi:hypothetical protein
VIESDKIEAIYNYTSATFDDWMDEISTLRREVRRLEAIIAAIKETAAKAQGES